ncbi:LysE family translocator [Actinospica robiniae]|uniref:LysE family translocator n=1 Tax=Actinospica robiniae TaxID=304901 RepID=UPI000412BE81|nr:LysE family translocator [Actinospica robiniae]
MRPSLILAFLAAVFPLVATPGASLTLVVREVTARGRGRALPIILGTVTGLYVHATLAIAGLSALVMHSSTDFEIVRLLGAAYLIGLGVHCWRTVPTPPGDGTPAEREPRGAVASYGQAVLANVLNPKAASIFLTLVPQFLDVHHELAPQILTLATAQGLLVAAWLTGWTVVLSGANRFLASARAKGRWKRITGCVLIGLGLRSALA